MQRCLKHVMNPNELLIHFSSHHFCFSSEDRKMLILLISMPCINSTGQNVTIDIASCSSLECLCSIIPAAGWIGLKVWFPYFALNINKITNESLIRRMAPVYGSQNRKGLGYLLFCMFRPASKGRCWYFSPASHYTVVNFTECSIVSDFFLSILFDFLLFFFPLLPA